MPDALALTLASFCTSLARLSPSASKRWTTITSIRHPSAGVEVTLPLPEVEDLSDCESNDGESLNVDLSITRPTRAFFMGCRNSILLTVRPRDIEDGRSVEESV